MAKKSKKKMAVPKVSGGGGDEWLSVDPERVRFQHARIRPYFSGCGRSVVETLESIRREELKPEDLPPIQVSSTLLYLQENELQYKSRFIAKL
jgi:hypothetical protein